MKFALRALIYLIFGGGYPKKRFFSGRRRIFAFQRCTIDYFFSLRPLATVAAALTVRFPKYLSDAEADPAIHGHAASHCIQKISCTEGDLPYVRSGIRYFAADLPYFEERDRGQNWALIYLIAEEVPRECPRACR
jgi:hypothetical protein